MTHSSSRSGLSWLIAAAILTVIIWQFPWGDQILYPFTILATWFHEMGHGLTAMLLGGTFRQLELYPNGSGIAVYQGRILLGNLGEALVAAGGPMGPPLAGSLLILGSRQFRTAHYGLLGLGVILLFSTLIWIRSWFGLLAIPLIGLGILGLALKAPDWLQIFAVQFLGVQACISTYHQIDYLFSPGAVIAGRRMLSDSSQIAQNLWLPYWFWGGLMTGLSLILLVQSLRWAYTEVGVGSQQLPKSWE